ncbi:Ribosomal large subunit pseudouridine synthase D [Pontiella desulfatans]|uniref:Ribosomal large subunit pseudouridine synthase D n=1 Tax=Pontiella desulfatans TaxID=2750659 RepID=A0A6C2UBX9_PONDE|nr:RluA family pseudouridine synthase [Pontiella desulfatans]VGO16864.1 Ribosomal large subunit pseudouridine synthase D [Pontiella desulfatans]
MIVRETHLVPQGVQAMRLSDYARTAFQAIPSRKGIAKAIKRGEIHIDGAPGQSGDWIQAGQTLELVDLQQRIPKTYRMPLEVVCEDDHLAVINKPPGIEVSGNKFKTIENALAANLAPSPRADALPWPRPVHRLDYSTSGLLLVAKTAGAQCFLGHCFEQRRIHKCYCAVVMGPLPSPGRIAEPINGLPAESRYEPLETVSSLQSGHLTRVNLFPETGRTHQLRIHMASIGHPIVGDQKYGEAGNILKGKGLFLAAVELRFPHPATQQEMKIAMEIPHKFGALLHREQARWDKFKHES